MHDVHLFLKALALVLCVAAVTTVLFQRLRQPVVLGYILAGLIIGPYIPIPLDADAGVVQTLSEIGVILLMFSLGLEFNLKKLFQLGPTAGLTAVVQCSLMMWLGFMVGEFFGWTTLENLFAGAIIATSSTTIIAKAFDEQRIHGGWRDLVVGILIVEDLIAILLMAALTTIASGTGLSASELALTAGRLFVFLALLVGLGLLLIPRAIRYIVRLNRPETTLVASIGICFFIALLAQAAGYSVALGAFLAGSLVAESGEAKPIEHLIQPVRDMFAAVFFVSVGMLIDPKVIAEYWPAVLVLTVVVVVGKIASVSLGAFFTGNGTRRSVQASMSLAQIGEFSFIIAGLGLTLGATRPFLYPIAVAVSAITTLVTPWLIRGADPAARFVDHHMPKPLQTFSTLYASWLEKLRTSKSRDTASFAIRRMIRLLVIDAALLVGIFIAAALSMSRLAGWVSSHVQMDAAVASALVVVLALVLATPFFWGIFSTAGRLGQVLAEEALPAARERRVDLGSAPRRLFVVTIQLSLVMLLGIVMLTLIQPFYPRVPLVLVLLSVLAVLAFGFWRSATNLQGHVRAGIQLIVEKLAEQSHGGEEHPHGGLDHVAHILPGLGDPKSIRLEPASYAAGRTPAELNLRVATGATVLTIWRQGNEEATLPGGREVLSVGDVLAVAGSSEAMAAAEQLLLRGPEIRPSGKEPEGGAPQVA